MEGKHLGGLALILFGSYFLGKHFGLFPRPGVVWPLLLIGLGLVVLFQAGANTKRTETQDGEVIYEVKGFPSLLSAVVLVPIIFIVGIVGLILLGVVGPLFLVFLLFIPVILFFKLGWAFLKVLFAIAVGAAPLLLILLLLFLIF
ncbi:MAG TPA: hypothetical protein GX393_03225 [Firmicutes bacterium]|jgi:hypothetical protein|nr:hypothetical protein [Bacillota bacterium]